jgi:uncharacterized membrane protein
MEDRPKEVIRMRITKFDMSAWFGATLPVVPGAAAVATIVLVLLDWPFAGNRGAQLAIALAVAAAVWLLLALQREE